MIAQERLDSHQRQRLDGIPVISVLTGDAREAIDEWMTWSARRGLKRAIVQGGAPIEITARWLGPSVRRMPLRQAALQFIGGDVEEFDRKSMPERRLAVEHGLFGLALNDGRSAARALCRALLLDEIAAESSELVISRVEAFLADISDARGAPRSKWLTAVTVAEIYGATTMPTLLVQAEGFHEQAGIDFDTLARDLYALVEACPYMAVGLAASDRDIAGYLRGAGESRWKAVVRDGVISCAASEEIETRNFGKGGKGSKETVTIEVPDAVRVAVERAKVSQGLVGAVESDSLARSAAEQFLFDVLRSAPDTASLFRLNASLPFAFGPKEAEVDLLAPELRLVIEIDGYHHFTDATAYRRDRRKDLLLQQRGYLVVRFLAEDVVWRLEAILSEIRGAIAAQRLRFPLPADNCLR